LKKISRIEVSNKYKKSRILTSDMDIIRQESELPTRKVKTEYLHLHHTHLTSPISLIFQRPHSFSFFFKSFIAYPSIIDPSSNATPFPSPSPSPSPPPTHPLPPCPSPHPHPP
jgi:hypothetical protein